ncbi:hypothetical protein LCGC14_2630650 [marine sediment metagenome]|uniref:DUF4062 domain-containing protein n=1 Tax=marine sediment metagenome TaxID=412755 RepID=A0A0F9A0I5_9ZZZZ
MKISDTLSLNPLKFFISSSWKGDLNDENKIIIKEIKKMSYTPITGDGCSNLALITHCQKKVMDADVLIVIFGEEYSSLVRKESKKALDNEIPILAFNKEHVEKDQKLEDYIYYLKDYIVYREFSDLRDLRMKVRDSIIDLISDCFRNFQKLYKDIFSWFDKNIINLTKKASDQLIKEYKMEEDNSID